MERNVLIGSYRFPAFDDEIIGNYFYGRLILGDFKMGDVQAASASVVQSIQDTTAATIAMNEAQTKSKMEITPSSVEANLAATFSDAARNIK